MKQAKPCAPGPGAYQADVETSITSGLAKRITSRAGVFGCVGPRFQERSRRAALLDGNVAAPGPGSYEAARAATGANAALHVLCQHLEQPCCGSNRRGGGSKESTRRHCTPVVLQVAQCDHLRCI